MYNFYLPFVRDPKSSRIYKVVVNSTKPLLSHRKAALTFLFRADLQQWSVNYGDSSVGFSNGNPFAFLTTTSITSADVYKWDSLRDHSLKS